MSGQTRPLVPGAGRVDVVVVLLLDRVLLDDAWVVGVLGDADRAVVLDALHTVAAAQPGAEVLETDPRTGADRERPDLTQPQEHARPPARRTISSRRASLGVAAELDEQAG